jgi:hypothetical protein
VVSGWKNKVQTSVANVLPAGALARQHRKMAEPGSAKSQRLSAWQLGFNVETTEMFEPGVAGAIHEME